MRWKRIISLLLAGLAWSLPAGAQERQPADYQDRGDRFEGSRSHPVGGAEFELLGAQIGAARDAGGLPENVSLVFFLRDPAEVHILVRERNPRRNYWLDQVRPANLFLPRSRNRFSWPAGAALQPLGIELGQLLPLVRLGYAGPRVSESVAPAFLGSAAEMPVASPQIFVFRSSRPAEIRTRLVGCPGRAEPASFTAPRRIPFEIRVATPGGACRLEIEGSMADDGSRIFQSVDFYVGEEGEEDGREREKI